MPLYLNRLVLCIYRFRTNIHSGNKGSHKIATSMSILVCTEVLKPDDFAQFWIWSRGAYVAALRGAPGAYARGVATCTYDTHVRT